MLDTIILMWNYSIRSGLFIFSVAGCFIIATLIAHLSAAWFNSRKDTGAYSWFSGIFAFTFGILVFIAAKFIFK